MRGIMRRFLCFVGRHDWAPVTCWYRRCMFERECRACGRAEWKPAIDVGDDRAWRR